MPILIGQTVSHYRILDHAGCGGMGVVYRAQDLKLDRFVALKFLPPDLTRDPEAKQRMIHEAKAASALQHTNICVLYDIDETEDGQIFISMEFLQGETLKKRIERGPLNIEEATGIARQVAHGLAKAHEHGIIHRDIKPANIIITTDGTAKIIDFGLARLAGGTRMTREGSTVGTVQYMSPEQGRGEEVDERTDIWSFGIVLYEMLTGRPPFTSEYDNAVIYSILNETARPANSVRPGVPDDISSLIARCLEKERQARPDSIGEILPLLDGRRRPMWTPIRSLRRLPGTVRYGFPLLMILVLGLALLLNRNHASEGPRTEAQKWRIAIMPFADMTEEKHSENWPRLIQAIMVDQLTGTEEIGVVDASSLNQLVKSPTADPGAMSKASLYEQIRQANISYIVEGMLSRSDTDYVARWTLTDVANQEVRLAPLQRFSGAEGITQVAQALSRDILSFFHVSALMGDKEADLKPWLKNRTRNIESLEAFLQGSEYAYRNRLEGRKYFQKALALDSTFIPPRIWLLSSLLGEGRFEEANRHYQTLLRLDGDANPFEHALIRYSGASLRGDLPAQKLALKEALEYSPRNQTLLYLLGRVCYIRNDFEGAAEAFQPLVDMNWRYQGAYYMLGVCYVQLKRFTEGKEILEKSLPLEPVYLPTYALLSALDLLEGDSSASGSNLKKYFVAGEENGHARDTLFYWLGGFLSSCGLHERAIDYFRRAVSLDPKNARYHLELASSLYFQHSVDSSESELFRTLELDPSVFEAHLFLGKVYESRDDRSSAIRQYALYLKGDSTSPDAREAQSRVAALTQDVSHK